MSFGVGPENVCEMGNFFQNFLFGVRCELICEFIEGLLPSRGCYTIMGEDCVVEVEEEGGHLC